MPNLTLDSRDAVAALLDHAILHPTATSDAMRQELEGLRPYPLASVCIKPYALPLAAEVLAGTPIKLCTVIGFPHGSHRPDVKAFEAERAMDDGATELDMVVNVGLVRSQDWDAVRHDVSAVQDAVARRGALLKVIFETDFIPEADLKIRLCEICSEIGVAFVKTSTDFGYVRYDDGNVATKGAQVEDLQLMRRHCDLKVGVKASGGVRSLDDLFRAVQAGANRIGTTSTHAILKQAEERFGA